MIRVAGAAFAASLIAACASAPAPAFAQTPMSPPMSSIQPETTITLTGRGSVDHAPDMATISLGVQVEAESASLAMSQQATKMNGVMAAVKAAGIAERDVQTSSLSLNPVYDYPNNQKPRLRGYQASNQVTIRVRKLDTLGKTLDATVKGGGNTINGISFGIDKPESFQDDARVAAVKNAAEKAELYAKAVGYRVKRIVTINENEFSAPPMPMMMRQVAPQAEDSTPIAAGEVSLTATVSVVFELMR